MNKPLQGCLVIDMTRVLAGPYCAMLLGDMGARVVKVEEPHSGDDSRGYGPFVNGESGYYMSVNRNKESITLNLKSDPGKDILRDLIRKADILIENFRPGTLGKLGFPFDELQRLNPRLVYTTVSGYGHTGPYLHKPAYDIIVQAMGGMMSITGQPEGPPTKAGASIGDITAALFATIGTLGAFVEARNGGKGQHVDISMLDTQVAILENAIARCTIDGEIPRPLGNRHPSITPFCSLPTSDGHIIIAVGNEQLWKKFCLAVGLEDLYDDNRFSSNKVRTENWSELEPYLNAIFREETTDEWLKQLEVEDIPCGPINSVDQVISDPQVQARNMVVELNHPTAGKVKVAGHPVKYSSTPCDEVELAPPMLGQHTNKILRELGLSEEKIKKLKDAQVI